MKLKNIHALEELLQYVEKYEIGLVIHFWPKQWAVYIAKDGVDLTDFGGDPDEAVEMANEYLYRITKHEQLNQKQLNQKQDE